MRPCAVILCQEISNKMQPHTVYFFFKVLYVFRVVSPPIIRAQITVQWVPGLSRRVKCLYTDDRMVAAKQTTGWLLQNRR